METKEVKKEVKMLELKLTVPEDFVNFLKESYELGKTMYGFEGPIDEFLVKSYFGAIAKSNKYDAIIAQLNSATALKDKDVDKSYP